MQDRSIKKFRKFTEYKIKQSFNNIATGTGKTYLSAFDAKAFNPKITICSTSIDHSKDSLKTFQKFWEKQNNVCILVKNEN
jgi:superfamily II DNA or RNA helicase